MPTRITDVLNIPRASHSDFEFVDVRLAPDTKLFIDPCLIASGTDEWSLTANSTIESYFDCFYSLYRNNSSNQEKLLLFEHAHEINATHLGYGNGNNGKAKTPAGMLSTFSNVPNLLQRGIPLSSACDLPLFIKDFAEDCLSDMLTNILLKSLMEFTIRQCDRYNAHTVPAPNGLYFWDTSISFWNEYHGPCLMYDGQLLLLVPKRVVRNRYYFTADQFFRKIILTHLQEESSWLDSNGKVQRLSKEDLRKNALKNRSTENCILDYTTEKPSFLLDYHEKLPSYYSEKGMSDSALDDLLYN